MGQTKYFVSHLEQRQGPFSLEEIQQKFNQNQLFPTDYIFVDEQNDWVLLFEFLQSKTPKAAATPASALPPNVPVKNVAADLAKTFASVKPEMTAIHIPTAQAAAPATAATPEVAPPKVMNVHFKNGEQVIELKADKVEKIKMFMVDAKSGVKSKDTVEMEVNSGPAESLHFMIGETSRAGEILKVSIQAVDNWKNRDEKYNGRIRLDINPQLKGSGDWEIKNGLLEISFVPTVATRYTFRAESLEMQRLKSAEAKAVTIKPAPAVTFTIEKPQNVRLGETVSIKVKAVDAYGNIDPEYQGSAVLNLEKTSKTG